MNLPQHLQPTTAIEPIMVPVPDFPKEERPSVEAVIKAAEEFGAITVPGDMMKLFTELGAQVSMNGEVKTANGLSIMTVGLLSRMIAKVSGKFDGYDDTMQMKAVEVVSKAANAIDKHTRSIKQGKDEPKQPVQKDDARTSFEPGQRVAFENLNLQVNVTNGEPERPTKLLQP